MVAWSTAIDGLWLRLMLGGAHDALLVYFHLKALVRVGVLQELLLGLSAIALALVGVLCLSPKVAHYSRQFKF